MQQRTMKFANFAAAPAPIFTRRNASVVFYLKVHFQFAMNLQIEKDSSLRSE
jgi:hypothetical protein